MPTTYNKSSLAAFFQTGDKPQGTDYENLIYSQVNIVETALQAMGGPLSATELIAPRVSATNIAANAIAATTSGSFGELNTTVLNAAGTINTTSITATTSGTFGVIAATSANLTNANVSAMRSQVLTIVASGTTLGTANLLTTSRKTLLTSVTDGTATGVGLLSNQTGLEQYLINDTAVSANLWPCTGGQINALASGAAFALAAHTMYTVIHIKASGYTVK